MNIPTGPIYSGALLLLSVYSPLFIFDKARDSAEGKTSAVNIVAALCSFFIVLAVLFRVEHWPPATTLITVGLAGFVLIFLPMLYFQKSRQAGANTLMNGTGALSLALFAPGVLNKIQHWTGPIVLSITGTALLFLIYIPINAMNKTLRD